MEKNNKSDRNVVVLGWVAFFGGLSQDMISPILPTFYSQVLGLNKGMIGLIEGSMTTVVSIFKILSGIISDKLRKRKSIVFLGYLLSAIGRVLLFLAKGPASILSIRLIDGVGKGLKDAPRDALVAESSDKNRTGFSFGLQRTLDTLGSFLGPLITAYLLMRFAQSGMLGYRNVFIIGGIVAFITIILISIFVAEKSGREKIQVDSKIDFSLLKGKFLLFFITMLVFTLGNSSDAFLILRAENVGVSPVVIPVIIAVFNLLYAALSIPSGILSDKIGRVNVIRLGWFIYAITYIGFALAKAQWHIWLLYMVYGIYYSTTEGVAKSLVTHLVNEDVRGTAFGLYNASIGLLAIPSSTIAGILWDKYSPSTPFFFGAICAILAIILITLFKIE